MTLETPPTEPAPPAPAPRACPRCGADLAPDQEWCLNCGADVGARVAETPRWRVPVIIVGTLLVLALGAVALALIELANDDQQVAQAPPAQTAAPTPTPTPPAPPTGEQPAPGEEGATPGTTVPEASDDATAGGQSGTGTPTPENEGDSATGQTTPTPTPSPGSTPSTGNTDSGTGSTGTIASWPSGKTAWTVILESATSKSAADAKAKEFSSDGTSVGVLHSDDFSSLNKGYWVVFSGTFDSKSEAESALAGLKAKVSQAYARHVVPR
jgi:septal ring-binding cell division protein DamX